MYAYIYVYIYVLHTHTYIYIAYANVKKAPVYVRLIKIILKQINNKFY